MDTRAGAGYAASWTTEGTSGVKTVTEAEWLACERPELLLRHLKAIGVTRWRRGERRRKLRLLGCAAFGQARHLLRPEYGQRAIELAERYADGTAELIELHQLNQKLRATKMETGTPQWAAEVTVTILLTDNDLTVAELALDQAIYGLEREAAAAKPNLFRKALRQTQAVLVRDIFGNPFRPITINPGLLTWHDGLLVSMAQKMYDSRDFADMPVLADALEEAGCTNQDILGHCRSGGEHVRGCWAVDLLLGKS